MNIVTYTSSLQAAVDRHLTWAAPQDVTDRTTTAYDRLITKYAKLSHKHGINLNDVRISGDGGIITDYIKQDLTT